MKKLIAVLGIIFIIFVVMPLGFACIFMDSVFDGRVVKVETRNNKRVLVVMPEKEKSVLKRAANRIKRLIYREATEHNPEGDVLPDYIDDKVKETIKERIE